MSTEAMRELETLASVCPELNIVNYTEDDVSRLNDWAIEMSLLVEKAAAIQQAEAKTDVRCEGCGYMTHHREHMGCVRAAKQFTHPAPGVPEGVAGELDPLRAYEFGQLITKYSESFNGQKWGGVYDSVDRKNLAVALDHLTEAGAMLMNISERLLRTNPAPAASVTDEQIAACVKRASTYGLPFVGLLNPGGTPSDFSKRFTAEILALRPVQVPMTDGVREQALDLLATLFDAYENGPACYESPDDCDGYLGNAVQIDHDTFHVIANLLNTHRPIIPAQAKKETP